MTDHDLPQINIREKLVHIDQMIADIDRIFIDKDRIAAERDRRQQEMRYAPALAIITGLGTGAALFAAGAAFIKLLG